jgi:UDP-N-acetylmuramoylalanine--D-glutamate ligase
MTPAVAGMTGRYAGRRMLVAGAGVSGVAVADALLRVGAQVTVVDRKSTEALDRLSAAGARILVGTDEPSLDVDALDIEEIVTSPGWRPDHPLLQGAIARGLPVYSEPELAWRLRTPSSAPWLAVTGTNGKTTTVTMLVSILRAAGLRTVAVGNIGAPLISAVVDDASGETPLDVVAVELSSFQLHWSSTIAPHGGVLLNLADDHLDWHGGFDAYAEAKSAVWRGADAAAGLAVGNADDPRVEALLGGVAGRTVRFTLGVPGAGELGIVEDLLVDRAFAPEGHAVELGTLDDVRPLGAHNIANALAAAALARGFGVEPGAVAVGLRSYRPEPHRNAFVAEVAGVSYVDDSKATNPHAALASLRSYDRVVWIAGGLMKGVRVDDLVETVAGRLAGVVLLGAERGVVAEALARHAPDVPVLDVATTDDGAMVEVVRAAARLAKPGDVVLLAPAAASMDMFRDYSHRGHAFSAAVAGLERP